MEEKVLRKPTIKWNFSFLKFAFSFIFVFLNNLYSIKSLRETTIKWKSRVRGNKVLFIWLLRGYTDAFPIGPRVYLFYKSLYLILLDWFCWLEWFDSFGRFDWFYLIYLNDLIDLIDLINLNQRHGNIGICRGMLCVGKKGRRFPYEIV